MAATRRTRKMVKSEHDEAEDISISEEEIETTVITTPPPLSFNGKLEEFAYAGERTSASASSGTKNVMRASIAETAASPSPSRTNKRKRESSSYAPPTKYAHLKGVPDQLADGLICVMIGLNPGIATAQAGHCYAAKSNLFWKLMFWGGMTAKDGKAIQCQAEDDVVMCSQYSLGNTNIVSRPSRNQAELTKAEMDASVPELEGKVQRYKPEAVNIVGKAIWESIWRAKHGGKNIAKKDFKFGWQDETENMGADDKDGYLGAKVFVVPSTSGLVAGYTMEFKKNLWTELGTWVNERRAERKLKAQQDEQTAALL